MSKKVYVLGVQPDPEGPVFGRNMDPADFQKAQSFGHQHAESVTRDLLIAGSVGPVVAGFNLSLTSGLGITIAAGRAVDLDGFLFELDNAASATLETADSTNPRIDLVYASLQKDVPAGFEFRDFVQLRTESELAGGTPPYTPSQINDATELHTRAVIAIRKGTAAGSPSVPAVGSNEVALFQIHVAAHQTSIAGGDVTDVRRTMRSLAQALVLIDALSGITGDLGETIDDRVAALVSGGTGIAIVYDDVHNSLTFSVSLDGAGIESLLGFVPVNKAGDTMTGALALPANGFQVGAGQLRAIGNNVVMSGEARAQRTRLKGGTGPGGSAGAFQFLLTNADELYPHRIVTQHDDSVGANAIDFYVWKHGLDNPADPSINVVLSLLDYVVTCRKPLEVLGGVNCSAATISGNCSVAGMLTKGSGAFLIDHPLDPANKNLIHSFIEGPRPDLIYRGRVRLQSGEAIVSIDEASNMMAGTFVALTKNAQGHAWNEDADYDNFDLVRVIKIEDGEVFIRSNNRDSSIEAGWMVVAERNDPFMRHSEATDQQGRFIVEADKPVGTEDELARALASRVEHRSSAEHHPPGQILAERSEVASELVGKRGYPIHAAAIGLQPPTRRVFVAEAAKPKDS